jgi:3-hydroxybutyrate dehydrogenase
MLTRSASDGHVSRVALVTGAASGIGAAILQRLGGDGWDVVGVDVKGDVDVMADLTTREGNERAVKAPVERFGRLDAVVPNAGFQHVAPVSAKHGLLGLVKTLALEGAPDGISANAVCPG